MIEDFDSNVKMCLWVIFCFIINLVYFFRKGVSSYTPNENINLKRFIQEIRGYKYDNKKFCFSRIISYFIGVVLYFFKN